MKDMFDKIKGHFILECLNKDNKVTDRYEEDNLIMDEARINMCDLVAGLSVGKNINKFILGTEGHYIDLITPKDSSNGFVSTRTSLFSEETSGVTYPIAFTPTDSEDAFATNIIEEDLGTTVHITKSASTVTYLIVIPTGAANGVGTTAYTEAALYADTRIFSMKTFGAKVKDDTVSLRITWSIQF